jgi:hypothetical protein
MTADGVPLFGSTALAERNRGFHLLYTRAVLMKPPS